MSAVLSVLIAILTAIVIIGGVLIVALKLSGRSRGPDPQSQGDTGSGSYDGYGGNTYDFGGDGGGGD